jgi:serine/threonine-protein kinase
VTAIEIPTPDPRTFDDATRPFAEAVSAEFAVKGLIGRGGMGMVFLARDRRLDRLVALKTLPPALASDRDVRERFLRETRTAGAMSHPNIVPIHRADEIGGHVFFAMSYVDGDSLAALIRARGRLDAISVARYMRDVAAALSHAHKRGIVHRDIKAENILIEQATDRALVTDFGIARLAEASPLTITGQVLGSVHYVSPEQVSGHVVDARSDIYSLGVVGFVALTGQFPFSADAASAVLVQHVTHTAPPVATINRDVSPAIAAIVDRCLMKDPAHRFMTADELHAAIEAALPMLGQSPVVVSDTAAHSIWGRAAELQANTGMEPRPQLVRTPRPSGKGTGASNSPGFRVGEVVAAASEAGIDERYVERALAEHGIGAKAPVPLVDRKPASPARGRERQLFWPLSRFNLEYESRVEGELPSREIERLINVLREQTGTLGTTSARSLELAWSGTTLSSRLHVSVVPEGGHTTVAMTRGMRLRTLASIVFAAVTVGFLSGIVIALLGEGLVSPRDEELVVFTTLIGGTAAALTAGGFFYRAVRARSMQRLNALGDVIATKVREIIGADRGN